LKISGGTTKSCSTRRAALHENGRPEVSEIQEILTRFWDQLIARPSGPLAFRLVLQPIMVTILAIIDGVKDARAGRPLYTWTILTDPAHRGTYLREGLKRVTRVIIFALVMDAIYQFMVLGRFYPGEALVIAFVLAILPYLLIRGPAARIARRWKHRDAAYDKAQ
jgi:hypothetical protein